MKRLVLGFPPRVEPANAAVPKIPKFKLLSITEATKRSCLTTAKELQSTTAQVNRLASTNGRTTVLCTGPTRMRKGKAKNQIQGRVRKKNSEEATRGSNPRRAKIREAPRLGVVAVHQGKQPRGVEAVIHDFGGKRIAGYNCEYRGGIHVVARAPYKIRCESTFGLES